MSDLELPGFPDHRACLPDACCVNDMISVDTEDVRDVRPDFVNPVIDDFPVPVFNNSDLVSEDPVKSNRKYMAKATFVFPGSVNGSVHSHALHQKGKIGFSLPMNGFHL